MTVVRILDWFRKKPHIRHIICPWCRCVVQKGDKGAPWGYQPCGNCAERWKDL